MGFPPHRRGWTSEPEPLMDPELRAFPPHRRGWTVTAIACPSLSHAFGCFPRTGGDGPFGPTWD